LDPILNWLNGLSRNAKIAIVVAIMIFTPVVGIAFSAFFGAVGIMFSALGFVLGLVNWGVFLLLTAGFVGYRAYRWTQEDLEELEEDEDDLGWDRFR
jgi:type III secretory pathway component EscS